MSQMHVCGGFRSYQKSTCRFFPGGKFEDMDECMKEQLMHCPLTNLVGESAFGDFDFDVCKRRNASLHNRSSMHSIKRNKTVKFISSKSRSQKNRLFGLARLRGKVIRKESVEHEKEVKNNVREMMAENQQRRLIRR